jgi:hypothetical protein
MLRNSNPRVGSLTPTEFYAALTACLLSLVAVNGVTATIVTRIRQIVYNARKSAYDKRKLQHDQEQKQRQESRRKKIAELKSAYERAESEARLKLEKLVIETMEKFNMDVNDEKTKSDLLEEKQDKSKDWYRKWIRGPGRWTREELQQKLLEELLRNQQDLKKESTNSN